jgi:DNA-binding Xre family transcriptional regulator
MLSFNLTPIFIARSIANPHGFLVKAGIPAYAASQLLNRKVTSLKLTHIEIICKALFCEPNDLLVFTPKNGEILPSDHPMNNLKKIGDEQNLQDIMAKMSLKEIKEVTKTLIEIRKSNPITGT